MFRNYLLTALRSLWRQRFISLINLLGMAIGFGIFLTLFNGVRYEASYDKFHEDIDRMYVLNVRLNMNGSEYTSQRTGGVYARVLPDLFPQLESGCRVSQGQEFEFGVPNADSTAATDMRYLSQSGVIMVDSNFFDYFSFPLVEGNPREVLRARDHIVITESLADKLFGQEDALGKQIRLGEGGYFTVAAVAADPPSASSISFSAVLGFHILGEMGYPLDGYGGTMYFNHFKFDPGIDPEPMNQAINAHVKENFEHDFEAWYFMDRYDRLQLYGENKEIVGYLVNLIMAIVVLLVACINFINLSLAASSVRLKEIAIRKSVGAGKTQLVIQFMSETFMLLLLAFYLGFFIAEHLSPASFRILGIEEHSLQKDLLFWLQILAIFLITGLLAGLYPALKISGFRPIFYFSDQSRKGGQSRGIFRKILIVAQFGFSIFFITASVFIFRQFDYLQEADLGFNREDVLYLKTTGQVWNRYPLLKEELEGLAWVGGVSTASDVPVEVGFGEIEWGERQSDHNVLARILRTGKDFLSTFDIELLEGDYFRDEHDSLNYSYVVVNRSLVDMMGWEEPVGRSFYLWGEDRSILGVTEDINFFPYNMGAIGSEALIYVYEPIQPYLFIRLLPGNRKDQLEAIEKIFRKHNPGYSLEYDFVSNYEIAIQRNADGIRTIFWTFSAITIFIAIMGLIGLVQFNNARRTKEIGIHKVMGAGTSSVVRLLLTEFIRLVALANLAALPLAWLALRKIFQYFSYSTDLKLHVFLLIMVASLMLALTTVLFLAWKSARTNPVNSLRYE